MCPGLGWNHAAVSQERREAVSQLLERECITKLTPYNLLLIDPSTPKRPPAPLPLPSPVTCSILFQIDFAIFNFTPQNYTGHCPTFSHFYTCTTILFPPNICITLSHHIFEPTVVLVIYQKA